MTSPGPANNTFSPYDEIWACGELLGLRGGGFCALILFYKFLKIEVIYSGKFFFISNSSVSYHSGQLSKKFEFRFLSTDGAALGTNSAIC